jgi:hypothetical protein
MPFKQRQLIWCPLVFRKCLEAYSHWVKEPLFPPKEITTPPTKNLAI